LGGEEERSQLLYKELTKGGAFAVGGKKSKKEGRRTEREKRGGEKSVEKKGMRRERGGGN